MYFKLSLKGKFGITMVNARLNIRAGRYTFDRLKRVKRNNVQQS